jgi:sigma-B regulation protein RsbU (phosphoserine phosphatase)
LIYAEAFQCPDPAELLRRVNRHLMSLHRPCLFVTVVYGVLHRKKGRFDYARAGHERPLLSLADGALQQAPAGNGQLLGVFPDPELEQGSLVIPPGGTLLLFTDGLTEGRSADGEPFGSARLRQALASLAERPAQQLCDGLLEALYAYQGGTHLEDDATLLAVRSIAVEK